MNIYLTLDYELFLNDISGDVEHCLLTPGNALLDLCDRQGIKATFFVDAAYLYRLNELQQSYPSLAQDLSDVSNHVREIVRRGHAIGLHIHSQWYYSFFDGEKWTIDFEHYKLSDMPQDEADEKFQASLVLLKDISGANITSFRGGGFSIQDYKSFPEIMLRNGIMHDTTALFKEKQLSKLHYYDYTSLKSSDHYHFSSDILVPDNNGKMVEFPISTANELYIEYCYNRYKYSKVGNNKNWGNGGNLPNNAKSKFIIRALKKFSWSFKVCASIDYQSYFHLFRVYDDLKKSGRKDMIILGHPKNLSPASLEYFEKFVETTINENTFKTM